MGIFDKFKKEEGQPEVAVKSEPVKAEKKAKPKKAAKTGKVAKRDFSEPAFRNLSHPLVTEKAAILSSVKNQYVFKVTLDSNKSEIKKAIQDLYGVKVEKVNVIKLPGKKRRVGRHEGFRSGFKKAIVFLAPDEKIELAN